MFALSDAHTIYAEEILVAGDFMFTPEKAILARFTQSLEKSW